MSAEDFFHGAPEMGKNHVGGKPVLKAETGSIETDADPAVSDAGRWGGEPAQESDNRAGQKHRGNASDIPDSGNFGGESGQQRDNAAGRHNKQA